MKQIYQYHHKAPRYDTIHKQGIFDDDDDDDDEQDYYNKWIFTRF